MAKETIVKQVDVMGLMGALQTKGRAKLSDFATPIDEEKPEVSPFEQKYRELKDKHPDALLLFRVGDFYEAYFEDAEESSKLLGVTLTLRSDDGSRKAGFPKYALDTYLPKLVRAGRRIAICDEIKINEPNKEDKTMRLNLNANKTENQNVAMQPQVNNINTQAPAIEDADAVEVTEVDDITPAKPVAKPKEDKPAVTIPLSEHGTMVIGGVPKHDPKPTPEKPKRDKNGKFVSKAKTETKPAPKAAEPDHEAVGELAGMMTKVTLVTYTTKNGDTAPRIVGFSCEDDPRWKPVNDEKRMLVEKYNKAKKTDKKAKLQSSPFGPAWLTDRETGVKTYCMTFGTKYMEVAKALCEAYNTTDKMAWHKAEDAVRALKSTIASAYKADREARKAERAAAREAAKPAEPAPKCYTNEDVAEMLRQVMAGGDVPEDIKELLKAA